MEWIKSGDFIRTFWGGSRADAEEWTRVVKCRAALGLIRARALRVIIGGEDESNDNDNEPLEPQPVPSRLWKSARLDENWVVGDFITDPHPLAADPAIISAFGVEFALDDLKTAGFELPASHVVVDQVEKPRERYQRSPDPKQQRVAKFLEWVEEKHGLHSKPQDDLHKDFLGWNTKQNKAAHAEIKALGLTQFKQALRRWRDGERW